jgi:enoyl-CoA hydratase
VSGDLLLLVERRGHVALLTFNRPEKLNALSGALRRAFLAALSLLAADEDVRVVVLTGAGRAFSAGLDLAEIAASGASVEANVGAENMVDAIAAFPKPIIGAINGIAVTGGFEIALALDILLVAEEASFIDSHVRVGITPGWGLSQRLARAVGLSRANELSLSARPLTAHEAVAWGLANQVYPAADLAPAALALAEQIAAHEPKGVRAMKALIRSGFEITLEAGLRMEDAAARAANLDVAPETVDAGFSRARAQQGEGGSGK